MRKNTHNIINIKSFLYQSQHYYHNTVIGNIDTWIHISASVLLVIKQKKNQIPAFHISDFL